jgi:hypothetical protein
MPSISPEIDPDEYRRDCVRIEPLCMEEEFVRLPADLAHWNAQLSDAVRAFLLAKLNLEETEAKLTIVHREALIAENGKTTESQVAAAVTVDPKLHAARVMLIEAEVAKGRIGGFAEAVKAKRDMLISLGAQLRAEMQGDPSIRQTHANARMHDGRSP